MQHPRLVPALLLAAATVSLTGCAGVVSLDPAEGSNDPSCAEVIVRLPETLAGEQMRRTDAQATAAWGDPATIILTCGVPEPGPTTLRCDEVSGVDWIIDESEAPRFRVVTFGREPAVELYFDTEITDETRGVSSRDVLDGLSPILREQLAPTGSTCVARTEATPVPSPGAP